jgi:hypothetical protein
VKDVAASDKFCGGHVAFAGHCVPGCGIDLLNWRVSPGAAPKRQLGISMNHQPFIFRPLICFTPTVRTSGTSVVKAGTPQKHHFGN